MQAGAIRCGLGFVALAVVALSCGQLKTLSRADTLSDADRLEYLVLASIAPGAANNYLSASTAQGRAEFLGWFWHDSPYAADSSNRPNYLDRARQARAFFGSVDLFGDDRVRTYIRYGPAQREVYEPKTIRTDTLTIIVEPAEVWTYPAAGLQFDFVKDGVPYRLVGRTEYGARVTLPALEQVDLGRPVPAVSTSAQPLGLAIAAGRLQQQGDSVNVELHYGTPLSELARLSAGRQPLLHVDITFSPRGQGVPRRRSYWTSTRTFADTALAGLAVAREWVTLPADIYGVTVAVVTADGSAAASRSLELNLVDYVRRAQPASDVLFYALADSTFQSPQFEGNGWRRLVPLVTPAVRSGSTCYILYQLYNLGLDATGQHRVEADYDFIEESTRELAIAASPTRFVYGEGTTATVVERVHTMNLRPGSYLLVARVRDLEADRTVSLTAKLEILPR